MEVRSRYIYESAPARAIEMDNPLDPREAIRVVECFQALHWANAVSAELLAGWIVAALASGAIPWRPHGLLNGPKGCGKSWVLSLVARLLGNFCVPVKGETTAAGLRQHLRGSAFPVLFDEAEGETERARKNMDGVLGLMRQASADGEAVVLKGSVSGKSVSHTVRSAFLLGAIRDPIKQAADESRVSVLSLDAPTTDSQQIFRATAKPAALVIGSAIWASRFRALVFQRMPLLLAATEVFARVGADFFGEQRMGDQIGAMASGVHVLTNIDGNPPTDEEALAWYQSRAWPDQAEVLEESSDEVHLLASILHAPIRVDRDQTPGVTATSVYNLLAIAASQEIDSGVSSRRARLVLLEHGLRVELKTGELYIANRHRGLAKLLEGTSWSGGGWGRLLVRLPGASKTPQLRFQGVQSRGVAIPLMTLFQ